MTVGASRTNGFLFADLRDYTRYVESQGDAAAARLLDSYRSVVRAAVAESGGAEIKTEGDSFYVVFPSASSAVQCGLAILDAAAERSLSDGVPLKVGIGVHAGETVETAEGYVGSAVNMAARVCSQARAGELLVTDTVRALTRTFLPVRFVDRRTRRLKGIAEPVVLYRVEPVDPAAAAAVRERATVLGRLARPSGVGRIARVGALLAGLLVGGAAAGYLLIAAQRPGDRQPGTAVSSPSPSAALTGSPAANLADADAELLAQIPLGIRDSCQPTNNAEERLGTVASVRCDLPLAEQADTVWYDQFDRLQAVADYVADITQRHRLPFGQCAPDVTRAQGNWQVGSTHAGRLLCYQADGASWIVWTYDAKLILARAVRGGVDPDDWSGLFEWWDKASLFLR